MITETVRKEAENKLPTVINRYFDEAGIDSYPLRFQVLLKCRRRLSHLFEISECPKKITPNLKAIEKMYKEFTRKTPLRERLVKIKNKKKRKSILPSKNDMRILAEAVALAEKNNLILVTDDGDYLEFKDEIEQMFSNIKITNIFDLINQSHLLSKN